SAFLAEISSSTQAVRVGAVTLLELGEMFGHEWPVLLRNARHIGSAIEDPNGLRGSSLLKEHDVRFDALAVWRKGAARQPKNRVDVAILHQDFKDLASFVLEETIVR